jgi:hypothetical protein
MATFLTEGEGKYIDADFPDIRCVPSREDAAAPRLPCNSGKEVEKSAHDLNDLEKERKKIKARDEALRERAFPS